MTVKNNNRSMLLLWIIAAVIATALISGMVVQSDLNVLTQTSEEINAVAGLLDSVSGLRSLLVSFSNQCSLAQDNWIGALNTVLGLLFLVSMLGFALVLLLAAQIIKNKRLSLRLNKLS